MENKDLLQKNISLFDSDVKGEKNVSDGMNKNLLDKILDKYFIKDMNDWKDVNADLIITDPPFGIEFSGKNGNYHRNVKNVVDGYVEWKVAEYGEKIQQLLECIKNNLKNNGQALIFSGWNNSNIIHDRIMRFQGLTLRGKMYWTYNFAPVCRVKPSHNVYEIYWVTKGEKWTYHNRCSTHHCQHGEPNLSSLNFKRDYKVNMPKYPTRLPFKLLQCLLEHFSNKGDLVFDPLCGSGMVGVVSYMLERDFIMGDLNKNGKIVFQHLLDYYLNKNGLAQDIKISMWWKNKK
jgi:DNA modification methylase